MNIIKKQIISSYNQKYNENLALQRSLEIIKIIISRGININTSEINKNISESINEFKYLTGQKPKLIYAKKHIAGFNIRKGFVIGLSVTLRKEKKDNFLKKFINLILPNVNNFIGIQLEIFDKKGNITFGISSQNIIPDLPYKMGQKFRGFNVTLVTSAQNPYEGLVLLSKLGLPIANSNY